MDIVDRLKQFINYLEIPVTKFADNCEIPRPTLSQLTNGRNKSVRNELVEKIHRAYPDLSMVWLMFGEGDMLHNQNFKTSEPQNSPQESVFTAQQDDNETIMPTLNFDSDETLLEPENFSEHRVSVSASSGTSIEFENPTSLQNHDDSNEELVITPDKSKHVVRIIAYYSDNSYQEFYPSQQ